VELTAHQKASSIGMDSFALGIGDPQAAGVFRCPKLICDKSIIHRIMGPPSYD
jgi:hypothetical protein